MLPNFYLAGFQKCGSSSLFDLLCQHPNIAGTEPKETYYLNDKQSQNYNADVNINNPHSSWEQFIDVPTVPKYILEASVNNFYQKTALNYISGLDDAKVIFIIRNPVDRFISTYNYYGAKGIFLDPSVGINEYFYKVKQGELNGHEAIYHALEHGRYCQYIDKWRDTIGNEKLMVVSLEQLNKNFKETLNSIWSFLQLQPVTIEKLPQKNKTKPLRYKRLNQFLTKLLGPLNVNMPKLRAMYKKWNRTAQKETVSEEVRKELYKYYAEEFKRFETYFNPG